MSRLRVVWEWFTGEASWKNRRYCLLCREPRRDHPRQQPVEHDYTEVLPVTQAYIFREALASTPTSSTTVTRSDQQGGE